MIHFVTALECEARPLVQQYRMKPRPGHGRVRFYEGESARLAVSGIGSIQAAIAVTAMGSRFGGRAGILWLNVGIAGHLDAPLGEAFLANRVSSDASRDIYYPQTLSPAPWKGIEVKTVAAPSVEYRADCLLEMEAHGFYSAALAFATSELVHCLKIVSDNGVQMAGGRMDKEAVSRFTRGQIDSIQTFAQDSLRLQEAPPSSPWFEEQQRRALGRYAPTETERLQLDERIGQLDHLLDQDGKSRFCDQTRDLDKAGFLKTAQDWIDTRSSQRIVHARR